MSTTKKILEDWKLPLLSDYRLSKLLDRHFDKSIYLSSLLQESHSTFSELYTKLSAIKQNLFNVFNEKLTENYEFLTKDLEEISVFSLDFHEIKACEKQIKSSINSLNKDFTQEYELFAKNLPLLERTYSALFLCKNSARFLQNMKLLRSLLVNNEIIDINKGSFLINELFSLAKTVDFSGLNFFETSKDFINTTRENLLQKTQRKFLANLPLKNEEEVKSCVKTFVNLGLLSEILTQTGTNMLKNCMNLWKNVLVKEYDQNTILLDFSNEMKLVLNESLVFSNSMWFLQNILRTFEEFELFANNDKNLLNIFELFWSKEINIISQSLMKLKENSMKYEINWRVLIRLYPRIFHLFEEFLTKFKENSLLFPEFCEEKTSLTSFMNPIVFLKDFYYNWLGNELETRFLSLNSMIFTIETKNPKDYCENIYQNSIKISSFLQYELNDNIKTKEIFAKFFEIFLVRIKTFSLSICDKIFKENFEDLSINTVYIAMNSLAKIVSDSLNSLLLNRNNFLLNLKEIDEFIDIYEEVLMKICNRFFEKFFFEILRFFSSFFENHAKSQKFTFQTSFWENFGNFLMMNNPLKFFNILEKYQWFSDLWEEFLFIILNFYAFSISNFNNSNEKFIEILNKDIDILNNLTEKISRKEGNSRISMTIINIHKLFLLDAQNIGILCQSNPNFFSLLSKNITIFNFLKRIERDFKTKKSENFFDILASFFNTSDLRLAVCKEIVMGDWKRTNCKEMLEKFKKNGVSSENENVKLIEKLMSE